MSIAWFGLWAGLTTKTPARATAKTISYVVIVPIIFSFIFTCGLLWPLITIVKDAIFINYGRSQLHQQLRNIVTEGAPGKPSIWAPRKALPPKLPNVLEK